MTISFTLVLKKMQPVPSESETPILKTIQTKAGNIFFSNITFK